MTNSRIPIGNGRYCYSGPNCRLHSARSAEKARIELFAALDRIAQVTNLEDMEEAKRKLEGARKIYDATDEGQTILKELIEDQEDAVEKSHLEIRLRNGIQKAEAIEYEAKLANEEVEEGLVSFHVQKVHNYDAPTFRAGTGEDPFSTPTSIGSKYEGAQTFTVLKSKINADIKEAMEKGYLPNNLVYNITIPKMRKTLKITIQNTFDEDVYEGDDNDYTPAAKIIKDRVYGIAKAYDSETVLPQVDHFNVGYYANVSFEDENARKVRYVEKANSVRKRANKPLRETFLTSWKDNPETAGNDLVYTHSNGNAKVARLQGSDIYVYKTYNPILNRTFTKAYDLSDMQVDGDKEDMILNQASRSMALERKNFLKRPRSRR